MLTFSTFRGRFDLRLVLSQLEPFSLPSEEAPPTAFLRWKRALKFILSAPSLSDSFLLLAHRRLDVWSVGGYFFETPSLEYRTHQYSKHNIAYSGSHRNTSKRRVVSPFCRTVINFVSSPSLYCLPAVSLGEEEVKENQIRSFTIPSPYTYLKIQTGLFFSPSDVVVPSIYRKNGCMKGALLCCVL